MLLFFFFIAQIGVNLLGVFSPEFAFDALWYHLTLPKIYLLQHEIIFIPGGLLYYSAMPKLAELLYVAGLSFGNEIIVKCIHFVFGLLTCFALYFLSRIFFTRVISLLSVIIFYSNIVVAWESTTAYIDLTRAFFETMALWAFVYWWQREEKKWLVISAVMLGFAITTKVLSIGSLLIFIILIFVKNIALLFSFKKNKKCVIGKEIFMSFGRSIEISLLYSFVALLVPLPWFIFSYYYTGNLVYPFFTNLYPVSSSSINLLTVVYDVWILFTQSSDPVSPVYLIFLPLIIFFYHKFPSAIKMIVAYSFFALVVWYVTPRTGGGRFIVPYLPAFSLLCASVFSVFTSSYIKRYHLTSFYYFLLGIVFFVATITLGYRFFASVKYFPFLFGKESKAQFLTNHLTFSYGDFYDTDQYFAKTIKPTDTVLLYGFHNLYYVDFPFIHESWLKKGDTFTYIATQNTELPKQYKDWKLVYKNDKTMVKLYKRLF